MGTVLGDLAKTPGVSCGVTRQVTGSSDGGPAQRPLQTADAGSGGRTAQQRARRSQRLSAVRGDSKTERPRPEVYRVPVSATLCHGLCFTLTGHGGGSAPWQVLTS